MITTTYGYYERLLNSEEVDFPHRVIWIPNIPRLAITSLTVLGITQNIPNHVKIFHYNLEATGK